MIEEVIARARAIPWGQISDPVGNADIADSLEELFSASSDKELESVFHKLVNATVPNLEMSVRAFYVVPFVLSLLRESNVYVSRILLSYLYEVLLSKSIDGDTVRLGVPAGSHQVLEAEIVWDVPIEMACRNAIKTGFLTIVDHLQSGDLSCRREALYILSEFWESAQLILPYIKMALQKEADPTLREAMRDIHDDFNWFLDGRQA